MSSSHSSRFSGLNSLFTGMKDFVGSASGQLTMFSMLFSVLPAPVAAGVAAVAASGLTVTVKGQFGDDDDASSASNTTPAQVSFAFTPSAPLGTNMETVGRVAAGCIIGATQGVITTLGEVMTGGQNIFSRTVNGVTGTISTNFGSGHPYHLNYTCAEDVVMDVLNGVPLPSPNPAEATGDVHSVKTAVALLATAFALTAGGIMALKTRREVMTNRAGAGVVEGDLEQPLLPAQQGHAPAANIGGTPAGAAAPPAGLPRSSVSTPVSEGSAASMSSTATVVHAGTAPAVTATAPAAVTTGSAVSTPER